MKQVENGEWRCNEDRPISIPLFSQRFTLLSEIDK